MICNTTFEVALFNINCSNMRIAILIGCIIALLMMIFLLRKVNQRSKK